MGKEVCCCSVQEVLWRTGTFVWLFFLQLDENNWWIALKSRFLVCSSLVVFPHQISIILLFSLHPLSSQSLGNGYDEGQSGWIQLWRSHFACNRLHAKSNCYLPTPFLYRFTFSKGPWQPWIAYLTTATLWYHNNAHTKDGFGFSTISVRRCRPVIAHVTAGAYIVNMADGGRRSCYRG